MTTLPCTTNEHAMQYSIRPILTVAVILCAIAAAALGATILIDAWRTSRLATAFATMALPGAAAVIIRDRMRQYRSREARRAAFFARLEGK